MILQTLVSGIMLGGIYSLISIGLTLIFGIVRVINFAHGDYLMVAMYLSFWAYSLLNLDPYVSIFISVPIMFLLGVLTYKIVIKKVLKAPPSMQIFATVGIGVLLSNLALFLWKADYRTIITSYQGTSYYIGPMLCSLPRLITFALSIVVSVGFFWFLNNTYTGKALRSVAQNREAALLMGINVDRIYMLAFGLGIACVGFAGSLLMPIYYVFPSVGVYFGITASVVVVLGGLGNMYGAFLGGLIIGIIEAFSGVYLDPSLKEAVYFALFILILIFRPQGLLGLKGAGEVGTK